MKAVYYLSETEAQELYIKAIEASSYSYSPYSKFSVGAALLTGTGKYGIEGNVYLGTNFENITYTGTIHAEKVAVSKARMNNDNVFRAIAVYASDSEDKEVEVTPCGDCRQFLFEFDEDIIVIFKHKGKLIQVRVKELLPYTFKSLK